MADNILAMPEFDFSELPELQSNMPWAKGVYDVEGVSLNMVSVGDSGDTALELKVKLDAIVETLPIVEGTPIQVPQPGYETSYLYFMTKEVGAGKARELFSKFAKLTGGSLSSTVVAAAIPGAKFRIVTGVRTNKLTKEQIATGEELRYYADLKNVIL